ncbi:GMC oxidoreductase [Thozetella sp. PMI_491]|nr:GMC oxidoreductase [Thozetella sp. PMI_491]
MLTYTAGNATVYDYIVVGSGPGGGKKVLLLEAGGDEGNSVEYKVPALNLLSTEYEPTRWSYYVNQYSDLGQQKRNSKMTYRTASGELYIGQDPPGAATPLGILYPRAGTLGGCSSHNAMVAIYPHRSDWSYIQNLTGDDSWAPDKMRKYFERLEKCDYESLHTAGHGSTGWLATTVTSLTLLFPDIRLSAIVGSVASILGKNCTDYIVQNIKDIKKFVMRDANADTPDRDSTEGLYRVPLSVNNGVRSGPREFVLSTANAVLENGARKYHLDIQLNTLVTKVRFDTSGPTPRAIGVDYLKGQSLYRADPRARPWADNSTALSGCADASEEVILSAGAFNTPQLLKLSGVGPAAELKSHGISVVVDLPGVGQNLQDRYEISVITTTPNITSPCTFLLTENDTCLEQWERGTGNNNRGIYVNNGITLGLVKKSSQAGQCEDPDLILTNAPIKFTGYYPGYARNATLDAEHSSWITLKAHARNDAGTVTLASADPRDMPVINFNSFAVGGDQDLQAMVEGMKLSRQIAERANVAGGFTEVWPGSAVHSDADLAQWVRNEAWGHHASCTCPIGRDEDPMAVLDSQFRVRKTQGLRVVDASVFPKIPGFYIVVPIYMISEKAADAILY